jgi:hypothetical protein
MLAACPSKSKDLEDYDSDCLTSNPGGDMNSKPITDAWDALIGKTIALPAFCGKPTCAPIGYTEKDGGNNAMYPVYRLVGVKVCGWHWGPKKSLPYASSDPTDPCYGADASAGGSGADYLLLAFTRIQVTGSTGPSKCAPGDPKCDGGLRRVLLTK